MATCSRIPLRPSIVEYVVVHALVHLRELNHTLTFRRGIEAAQRLARNDWRCGCRVVSCQ